MNKAEIKNQVLNRDNYLVFWNKNEEKYKLRKTKIIASRWKGNNLFCDIEIGYKNINSKMFITDKRMRPQRRLEELCDIQKSLVKKTLSEH